MRITSESESVLLSITCIIGIGSQQSHVFVWLMSPWIEECFWGPLSDMKSWAPAFGSTHQITWQTNKTTHGFQKVHEFRASVKEGAGIWFLADTRGKSRGLMSDSKREREREGGHEDSSILCLTPHLSHGIWFVYKQESVTGSFLVSWLQPAPGRRQPGWTLRPSCRSEPLTGQHDQQAGISMS